MSGRDDWAHRASLPLALLLATLTNAAPAQSQQSADLDAAILVRKADGAMTRAVQRAVRLASHWLADARCQQVFTDFRDAHGQELAANLRATGLTGAAYLRFLVFWDGNARTGLRSRRRLRDDAAGQPRRTRVPGVQKARIGREQAAAIVIHEELHSLGLGENPPSSLEITQRVLSRCARTERLE